ncbi:unnamed protein product [Rhizoctonia solani]|uniref:Uncharacterized protein n=1 Tax=Rhizoctonia solani TaxID=456999 RepID=A0A8H3AG75_9AGAM|nr:unnamed protein product [Rhizoctonia solani]
MNDLISLALGPVISCSGAASRPLASSINASMRKFSADRIQKPIILDFHSHEGKEELRNWYNKQPTTRFMSIEWCKDIDGRAREDLRGHALKHEGTISEDSAHVITSADIESRAHLSRSEVLLKIDLPEIQDLWFVLTVCCGIHYHPKAKSYSLLYYNCYFFSWTLITIVARRTSKWESMKPNRLWEDIVDSLFNQIGREGRFSLLAIKSALHALGSDLMHMHIGSTIGTDSHIAPLPPAGDYIYKSIEKELLDAILEIPLETLEKLLLKTQLSHTLNQKVSSALSKGGQTGAEKYAIEVAKAAGVKLGIPFAISDALWDNLPDPEFTQPIRKSKGQNEASRRIQDPTGIIGAQWEQMIKNRILNAYRNSFRDG